MHYIDMSRMISLYMHNMSHITSIFLMLKKHMFSSVILTWIPCGKPHMVIQKNVGIKMYSTYWAKSNDGTYIYICSTTLLIAIGTNMIQHVQTCTNKIFKKKTNNLTDSS